MCLEAFYGGAAGGGKSDALLMAALQFVDIPGYSAILIRDTFQNLNMPDSLIPRSHEWLQPTDASWSGEKKQWNFPSGAVLKFGYLDSPLDHYNYQSAAFQFVGIDEAVNIRENQSLYMFSRLRKLEKYKDVVPLRFRVASNPPQREQVQRGAWVKARYVNQRTREKGAVFIPAWMTDNPFLDQNSYRESLAKLDPVTRAQLEKGDWDIQIKGRMFDRAWFKVVPIPPADVTATARYWDRAASEEAGKYTSGSRVSKSKAGLYYIESIVRFRKSSRGNETVIRQVADIDGRNIHVWMEQEPGSSGVDTIDNYRRNILPEFVFRGDKVTGSKIERATPLASQAEAGNVFVVEGNWNKDFFEEIELFPDGEYSDQVDSTSGAFNRIAGIKAESRLRTI